MTEYNIYSKRHKSPKNINNETYEYTKFPPEFRAQVVHILNDSIGTYSADYVIPSNNVWDVIFEKLTREYGTFQLISNGSKNHYDQCIDFLLEEKDVQKTLDIIELSFRVLDIVVRQMNSLEKERSHIIQSADSAIQELNSRFEEHRLGYSYQSGIIISKDTEYTHKEIILPAIILLQNPLFSGAFEEFMSALKNLREGNAKQTIADCSKAFESTIKTICKLMNWQYDDHATAAPLIKTILDNELIPKYMQDHFTAFGNLLVGGLPTIGNRTSRHGQGAVPIEVPDYFASYAIQLCAVNIVFIIRCYEPLSK